MLSRHDWAEHLIWMEGGEPPAGRVRRTEWVGLFLALGLAFLAYLIPGWLRGTGTDLPGFFEPTLLGMLSGLLVGNIIRSSKPLSGVVFAVRVILPAGIVLLGARMDFFDAMKIGLPGIALSIVVVALSIATMLVVGRILGLGSSLSCLLGVGTGICGGTAIIAVAPLLKSEERDVMLGVCLVTFAGLVGMLVMPPLAKSLGFSASGFGLLAGLTIHQTPQAIAAGFTYGEESGHIATVAKMARVCLLAPVSAIIAWWMTRVTAKNGGLKSAWRFPFLPGFVIGFLIFAAARSLGLLPDITMSWDGLVGGSDSSLNLKTEDLLKTVAGFLLTTGMVGVGYQTRLSRLRKCGWKPLIAVAITSLLITIVVAGLITALFD